MIINLYLLKIDCGEYVFLKIKRTLVDVIYAEGFAVGIIYLLIRLLNKIKSHIFSKLLKAKNINFGSGCQFRGINCIQFGEDIAIHRNSWIEAVCKYAGESYSPVIVLGDRVKMSNGVHITCVDKIVIGHDVLIGSNVYISDHNHGVYNGENLRQSHPEQAPAERKLYSSGPVIIEGNVWIGDNVNIVGPLEIGFGSIIAANSVVRKNVPAHTIVAGCPAKKIKIYNKEKNIWEKA